MISIGSTMRPPFSIDALYAANHSGSVLKRGDGFVTVLLVAEPADVINLSLYSIGAFPASNHYKKPAYCILAWCHTAEIISLIIMRGGTNCQSNFNCCVIWFILRRAARIGSGGPELRPACAGTRMIDREAIG